MLPHGFDQYDRLNKSQWLESVIFMSSYLLSSQGDRVSMANSVEGRYPFLDYRVMEFAAKLPSDYKMHGLNEKFILKRMMNNTSARKCSETTQTGLQGSYCQEFPLISCQGICYGSAFRKGYKSNRNILLSCSSETA